MPITQSVTSRADRKRWIEYPYQKYKGHPTWVPPLLLQEWEDTDQKKNPFFEHSDVELLLALDGTRVVGRIRRHSRPQLQCAPRGRRLPLRRARGGHPGSGTHPAERRGSLGEGSRVEHRERTKQAFAE
ncbi:MAG: hypothetical protein HC933_18470 [Pleurocapsa sp. SU_196_0]|nr:hypothetical protein [Pleurocapsa sp. SU_196_0]